MLCHFKGKNHDNTVKPYIISNNILQSNLLRICAVLLMETGQTTHFCKLIYFEGLKYFFLQVLLFNEDSPSSDFLTTCLNEYVPMLWNGCSHFHISPTETFKILIRPFDALGLQGFFSFPFSRISVPECGTSAFDLARRGDWKSKKREEEQLNESKFSPAFAPSS